ncbi:hypothetical protein BKH42_07105 [Helicobacter sp. 13S00482-2]|uniref:outer membrane beta-barrel protein n=1 Tax=Helicobacter sp. 13S00482-2 TaxID=1476200 RepID=UPI000BA6521C|nr:outer membrane beta-barrel protein [Helicobacter sp. 13S00482-2]PAF53213.1 hypothetical protein BKH42_07105 [Helicobacter sp. 13S00482-2]
MKKLFLATISGFLIITNSFGMDAKEKTGFFVGIDLNAATFKYSDDIQKNLMLPSNEASLGTHYKTSFNYGVKIGYQFYGTPHHGLRLGAHLNMGDYSLSMEDGSQTTAGIYIEKKASYFALRYGMDMDYLFDFYNSLNTSLGLSAGVGYEFANYINGKTNINFAGNGNGNLISFQNSLFGNGAYINVGLHYYFKKHQFAFETRLPFSVFGSDSYSADGSTKAIPEKSSSFVYQNVKITANASYHFNYAYLF